MRSIEDVLPNPIHPKLPDSTFEIIGGYKDAHAAKVTSQLTVCYVNLNGLNDKKTFFGPNFYTTQITLPEESLLHSAF